MTLVCPTHDPGAAQAAIAKAVALLSQGELVALPTETVYGLAGNALNPAAVEKIFHTKGRPARNPLIVHVSGLPMAQTCVAEWPDSAAQLARAFWPGPLTLVLPKSTRIPGLVTAQGSTVAVRWPRHPIIQAVIEKCGFPLAAPSANASGEVSPTTAEHVRKSLGGRIPLIIDGGPTHVGIESTVLDLASVPPRVLRPGIVHREALAAVLGRDLAEGTGTDEFLRSPGLLLKHYAPKARTVLWNPAGAVNLEELICSAHSTAQRIHLVLRGAAVPAEPLAELHMMPDDPVAYARTLYAELHRCDEAGADLIVIEEPPGTEPWSALTDRLRRAAA